MPFLHIWTGAKFRFFHRVIRAPLRQRYCDNSVTDRTAAIAESEQERRDTRSNDKIQRAGPATGQGQSTHGPNENRHVNELHACAD